VTETAGNELPAPRRYRLHGREMAVRVAGTGPVVVLLHGITGSSANWAGVLPTLAEQATVIAPDLPGHGASAAQRSDYSIAAYANAVRDLLVAIGHERATLVGHSLGGGVAMQFAYQFPQRCERLVLVSSGGLGHDAPLAMRALAMPGSRYLLWMTCNPLALNLSGRLVTWWRRNGLPPSLLEDAWASYRALCRSDGRRVFSGTIRTLIGPFGQRETAMDRLYLASELPVLIVWGARDPVFPLDHALAAHRALPGSRLEVFEDVGHRPHWERPDRFAGVVADFLRSTEPATFTEPRWRELFLSQPGSPPATA
jgi:pimeloyl-ACP methyl ester carboxylesterase